MIYPHVLTLQCLCRCYSIINCYILLYFGQTSTRESTLLLTLYNRVSASLLRCILCTFKDWLEQVNKKIVLNYQQTRCFITSSKNIIWIAQSWFKVRFNPKVSFKLELKKFILKMKIAGFWKLMTW